MSGEPRLGQIAFSALAQTDSFRRESSHVVESWLGLQPVS